MKKRDLSIITSSIALVGGAIIGLTTRQKWWFYILLIFIIAPAFGSIGYALGKTEEECDCPGNNK